VTTDLVPAPRRPQVLVAPSPFRTADREFHPLIELHTLAEVLADVGVPLDARVQVLVDGEEVHRERWASYVPSRDALVVVRRLPEERGSTTMKIIGAIFVLVVTILTFGILTGPAVGLTSTAAYAVTAVVNLGLNLAINALLKPPPPSLPMQPSTKGNNLVDGTKNRMERYAVVPMHLGAARYTPPQAMRPFTESRAGKTYVTQMFDFGRGPVDFSEIMIGKNPVFSDGRAISYTQVMQSDGYYRKIEVELRRGTPTDAPITLVSQEVHEEPLSVELPHGTPAGPGATQSRNTLPATTEISFDLSWNGLGYRGSSGSSSPLTIVVQYRTRNLATGATSAWTNVSVTRNVNALIRRTVTFPVASGQYGVDWRRLTPVPGGTNSLHRTFVTALRSKRMGDPLHQSGHARIVTRITGSELVGGLVDELSAFCQRTARDWNGASWSDRQTRSPSAAILKVLQDDDNRLRIATADLSKWVDVDRLEQIAEECIAERRYFDATFDDEATVLSRLRTIAFACRAVFTLRDGKFSMVRDYEDAPVAGVFTNINSWGFKTTKLFPTTPHGLKCRFINPLKGWVMDEQIAFDDGYSLDGAGDTEVGTEFDEMTFVGMTDPSIVWADARYHMAVNRRRDRVYEFSADWEYRTCELGDRVRVSHDAISVGLAAARVKELVLSGSDVVGVVLDQICKMETGGSYALRIRRTLDWTTLVKALTTVVGLQETVTFASPITVAGEKPAVGDLVVFGELGEETVEAIVTNIRPSHDMNATIVCVPVAPEVYEADQGARPPWAMQAFGEVPPDSRNPTGIVLNGAQSTSSTSATFNISAVQQ
jgi:sulfur carrier protein ThiS